MKILVVHPAQQHSYHMATALEEKGYLYKYITTVYYKKYSFTHVAAFFLRGTSKVKAKERRCPVLKDNKVVQFCELEGLIKLMIMRSIKFRPFYRRIKYHLTDRFARKVVNYAIKHNVDAVVSYDDYSSVLFEKLKEKAPDILRIMDMSAANILYMREIYDKDKQIQPNFADRLSSERFIVWNKDNIIRVQKELLYTNYFFVPSQFVAESLNYSGIMDNKIRICPYGVDINQFREKEYSTYSKLEKRQIHFIYVGGVKELKGISYLLQAFVMLPKECADLTVVGQVDYEAEDIRPYRNKIKFTGSVLHSEIVNLLHKADVFVFPSLGEGLSLAALEAASCGLPLIVSKNSGINDAITDGKEGFVIPIQSVSSLVEKMEWFIEHPEQIEPMGREARKMALSYTWESYYQCVQCAIEEIGRTNGKDS